MNGEDGIDNSVQVVRARLFKITEIDPVHAPLHTHDHRCVLCGINRPDDRERAGREQGESGKGGRGERGRSSGKESNTTYAVNHSVLPAPTRFYFIHHPIQPSHPTIPPLLHTHQPSIHPIHLLLPVSSPLPSTPRLTTARPSCSSRRTCERAPRPALPTPPRRGARGGAGESSERGRGGRPCTTTARAPRRG